MIRQCEWTAVGWVFFLHIHCVCCSVNAYDELYIKNRRSKKSNKLLSKFCLSLFIHNAFKPMQRVKKERKIVEIKINGTIEWNDAVFIAIRYRLLVIYLTIKVNEMAPNLFSSVPFFFVLFCFIHWFRCKQKTPHSQLSFATSIFNQALIYDRRNDNKIDRMRVCDGDREQLDIFISSDDNVTPSPPLMSMLEREKERKMYFNGLVRFVCAFVLLVNSKTIKWNERKTIDFFPLIEHYVWTKSRNSFRTHQVIVCQ